MLLLTLLVQGRRTRVELSWCAQTRFRKSKRKPRSLSGFHARSTCSTTVAAIRSHPRPPRYPYYVALSGAERMDRGIEGSTVLSPVSSLFAASLTDDFTTARSSGGVTLSRML